MVNARLILLITICLCLNTVALAKEKPIILSQKKKIHSFNAHQSIKYEKKQITLIKNTNAFCPNSTEFFAGLLTLKKERVAKERNFLIESKIDSEKKSNVTFHNISFEKNHLPISDNTKIKERVIPIMQRACELSLWDIVDGVIIKTKDKDKEKKKDNFYTITQIKKNKIVKSETLSPMKECKKESKQYICSIKGYGKFYLDL